MIWNNLPLGQEWGQNHLIKTCEWTLRVLQITSPHLGLCGCQKNAQTRTLTKTEEGHLAGSVVERATLDLQVYKFESRVGCRDCLKQTKETNCENHSGKVNKTRW